MKRCPFSWKECRNDCVLYRRGMRYFDNPLQTPIAFEECAVNIGIDCLENLIGRSIGQQKAQEQTRNEVAALKELFYNMAVQKQLEAAVEDRAIQLENKRKLEENVIEVGEN